VFGSLLIANRGEIACRIIRTARRLGLASVAVHSEADAAAPHVRLADRAELIGPAPAAESYLAIDRIIAAAKASGAEAVHPGYGFLSENADFAEACAAAGLVFVGPPPAAIRAMGSKSAAKALMEQAGVPLVPGYHGAEQLPDRLLIEARAIGFPLLIKASAGGGGKGMRVVEAEADFPAALESARREAAAAFGDNQVLLERYLTRPRHIEVQVFCDTHGNGVHLFERDCSLQRRHQKVVEEAPAPGLAAARREAMGAAALRAAQAVGYVGAGTVEFIVDEDATDKPFYFMEMNTRLQVEHPVTEMITGQDLVEWQLRVAAGEPLPLSQDELQLTGHAFEARLYAEDPARDFLPATGRLTHLTFPVDPENDSDPHVRVDSGVVQGDSITTHYDPMIAKLIVWDRDRSAALRRLSTALGETRLAGPRSNLDFLRAVAAHPAFARAELDTGFIERHRAELLPAPSAPEPEILALAALAEILLRGAEASSAAAASGDPHSPWGAVTGWRLNSGTHSDFTFLVPGPEGAADEEIEVRLEYGRSGFKISVLDYVFQASGELESDGSLTAALDGRRRRAVVVREPARGGTAVSLLTSDGDHHLNLKDPLALEREEEAGSGRLTAPMPGKVTRLLVGEGAEVARGAPLLVLEAMKMEHTITAPSDGRVAALHYREGDLVEEGAALIEVEGSAASG